MKLLKIAFLAALALAAPRLHAVTGAAAAESISSTPDDAQYVTPESSKIEFSYFKDGAVVTDEFTIDITSWENSLDAVMADLKSTVNSVAINAFKSLAQIEMLKTADIGLGRRIDTLTDSVKNAFSSLDDVTETVNTHTTDIQQNRTDINSAVETLSDVNGEVSSHTRTLETHTADIADLKEKFAVDGHSLGRDDNKQVELANFHNAGACERTLSGMLTGNSSHPADHLLVAKKGNELHYVSIGAPLDLENTPVDGDGIVTNTTGALALYGWDVADGYDIPSKVDGHLQWAAPGGMVDDSSIGYLSDVHQWEVKGAHAYAGQSGNHYFGTGDNAALGWHELPNVTTNVVAGDEKTITSYANDGTPTPEGVKKLGLYNWNYGYSGDAPLFLANMKGALDYIPLPDDTNSVCACSNNWASLAGWVGGAAEVDEDGSIELPDESMYDYLASLGAPEAWADNASTTSRVGRIEIMGFAAGGTCQATMAGMLTDAAGEDAQNHAVLTRFNDNGEYRMHYVPIGSGLAAGSALGVRGTSGAEAVVGSGSTTNWIQFASAADSNVQVTPSASGNTITVTIGVYYRHTSSVTPPNVE